MARRLLSIWFPRLASDTSLRRRPVEGPFALTHHAKGRDHIHCLNPAASARGMALADARAICPDLATRPIWCAKRRPLPACAAEPTAMRRWSRATEQTD